MGRSFEEGCGFLNWKGWYGKVRFSVDDWFGVSEFFVRFLSLVI